MVFFHMLPPESARTDSRQRVEIETVEEEVDQPFTHIIGWLFSSVGASVWNALKLWPTEDGLRMTIIKYGTFSLYSLLFCCFGKSPWPRWLTEDFTMAYGIKAETTGSRCGKRNRTECLCLSHKHEAVSTTGNDKSLNSWHLPPVTYFLL